MALKRETAMSLHESRQIDGVQSRVHRVSLVLESNVSVTKLLRENLGKLN